MTSKLTILVEMLNCSMSHFATIGALLYRSTFFYFSTVKEGVACGGDSYRSPGPPPGAG